MITSPLGVAVLRVPVMQQGPGAMITASDCEDQLGIQDFDTDTRRNKETVMENK